MAATLRDVAEVRTDAAGCAWYRGMLSGRVVVVTVPPRECDCGCGEYETECQKAVR